MTISADEEHAHLDQMARDVQLFKSQYVVQPRQLSAEELLGIVKFLINWDLHFSRYNQLSQSLVSASKTQMSSQLALIHAFIQSQIKTFQKMYADQLHHVGDLHKIIQDANMAYDQSLLQGSQDSAGRVQSALDGFRELLES